MMNNILFTKKPNKQKNIENAVIYCIHIPLEAPSTYHLRECYGVLPEVIACACTTGSCITGYDITGSCITGNEREIISRGFFTRYFPRFSGNSSRLKTKTKRIISETSRKNITKTKTIRIISEQNISSIEAQLNLFNLSIRCEELDTHIN
jgi:hypothetical protein